MAHNLQPLLGKFGRKTNKYGVEIRFDICNINITNKLLCFGRIFFMEIFLVSSTDPRFARVTASFKN